MPIEVFKNTLGQLTAHSAEKCLTITEDVMIIMGSAGHIHGNKSCASTGLHSETSETLAWTPQTRSHDTYTACSVKGIIMLFNRRSKLNNSLK